MNVKRIVIVRLGGADKVSIEVEGPSPFPEMDAKEPGMHPPCLTIDVPCGYAEEWLIAMGFNMSLVEVLP